MRLFIAIPLPPDIQRDLEAAKQAVIRRSAGGRFEPAGNFHITLHFIGESDNLSGAALAMHESVRGLSPFRLRLGQYGSFERDSGRISFIDVTDGTRALFGLYESLQNAMWENGFARGRGRFEPHITLGRSVVHDGEAARLLFDCCRHDAFTADTIILYESRRVQGQMVYTPVHRERFAQ